MAEGWVQVHLRTSVDAGDLLGFLDEASCLGACEREDGVYLYWERRDWSEEVLQHLHKALDRLGDAHAAKTLTVADLPDQDWNAIWAASLEPICIGHNIFIRQSWNPDEIPVGRIALIIDPKRAFGTGYHATTQLIVEALDDCIQGNERILDVGTGSGILAMIGLRLGARAAVGIDSDPEAIECALECAAANGFGDELRLHEAALEDLRPELFDMVLANLDRKTLLGYFAAFHAYLKPRGLLIVSGLQPEDIPDIQESLAANGWKVGKVRRREDWAALELQDTRNGGADETRTRDLRRDRPAF